MHYAAPIVFLTVVAALFFYAGRHAYTPLGRWAMLLRILVAALLLFSGLFLHFLRPRLAYTIMPPALPHPLFLIVVTGIFEVLGAVALFLPRLRRPASVLLVLLMLAVFPANIYAAGKVVGGIRMPGLIFRTAMQAVYIFLILLAGFGWPARRSRKTPRQ